MIKDKLKAMVLAAGIGSRLEPLSSAVPKPLIQIAGKTVMDHILLLLKKHGITQIISNTHHLSEQIEKHFANIKNEQGIEIEFRHEDKLSGVAGGIRLCKDFLAQSTSCIIMGDALTDLDLSKLYEKHKEAVKEQNCIATIAMMPVIDTSQFGIIVTEAMLPNASSKTGARIVQFQEKPSQQQALSKWANTGIYFFEPEIFDFIPGTKEAPFYDVAKNLFPKLLQNGKYLQAICLDTKTYWADLGTPQQYIDSIKDISSGKITLDCANLIDPSADIPTDVKMIGANQVGANTRIGSNSIIENSIIWDNVIIEQNSIIKNSIIGSNCHIEANSLIDHTVMIENSKVLY